LRVSKEPSENTKTPTKGGRGKDSSLLVLFKPIQVLSENIARLNSGRRQKDVNGGKLRRQVREPKYWTGLHVPAAHILLGDKGINIKLTNIPLNL